MAISVAATPLESDGLSPDLGHAIALGKGKLAPVDHGDGQADNLFVGRQLGQPGIKASIVYDLRDRIPGESEQDHQAGDDEAWKPHRTS